MKNNKFLEIIKKHFNIHDGDNYVELETWTDGGVNMFVTLDKDSNKTYFEQFSDYVGAFDTDEQIDSHREDKQYKNNFTIRESVHDFESYEERLQDILSELEK